MPRLGSEHPLCDSIQLIILILFFVTWGIDSIGKVIFGVSTIFVELVVLPLLLLPAIFSWSLGIYLTLKSHETIFGETTGQPMLNDSGVYSWVRHPMYLGILLFCLGFLFIMPSLFSLGVWVVFFIFYDKMATYEENDLVRILSEKYIDYQKRVPRWLPKLLHFSSKE
jgi:protein-S-isoprenylcysteine O-methyltransferase Ste14